MADGKKNIKINFLGDSKEMQKAAKEGELAVEGMVEGIQGFAGRAVKALAAVSLVGVGAVVADSFVRGWDNLNLQSKLQAQLGQGTEAADAAGMAASALYAEGWGQGLEQVNDAVRAVSTGVADLYGLSQEELRETSKWALNLADAFGVSVDVMTEGLGKALASDLFENVRQGMDWFTAAIQGLPIERAQELGETFNEYSTMFRDVGIGGPMAIGLLRQAVLAGARDIDTAADAIKEFAIRSQDGSKSSAEAFELIGMNAKEMTQVFSEGGEKADLAMTEVLKRIREMPDGVDKTTAKVGLFGTKAEDLADALYALDPTTALKAMGDVDGRAAQLSETMASPIQQIEAFRRKLVEWATTALSNMIPALQQLGSFLNDTVVPALAAFGSWFMENKGEIAFWAGLIASLVGPIWLVMQAFAAWNAIIRAVAITQAILNAVMALNPAILIVTAILALVGVFVYLWNTSEGFRQFWIDLWNKIVEAATGAWEWIKQTASDFWNWITTKFGELGQWFSDTWNGISQGAQDAWQAVKDAVSDFVDAVRERWEAIKRGAIEVWQAVWNAVKPVIDAIGAAVGFVVDVIVGYFKVMYKIYETIFYLMKFVVEQAFSWILNTIILPFVNYLSGQWELIKAAWGMLWDAVSAKLAEVWAIIAAAIGVVVGAFQSAWNAVRDAFVAAWEAVVAFFRPILEAIVGWVTDKVAQIILRWELFKIMMQQLWDFVWNQVIRPVIDAIVGFVTSKVEMIQQRWIIFKDAVANAWQSIKDAAARVIDAIRDAWDRFTNKLGEASDKISNRLSGMWDGVKNGAKSAINWMVSMVNKGIRAINSLVDGLNKVPGVSIPHIPEIPGLYKGGRAMANRTYLVGEQGPELFTPTGSGTVTPNGKTMDALGGGGPEVHVYIGNTELRDIVRTEVGEAGRATARRSTSSGGVW